MLFLNYLCAPISIYDFRLTIGDVRIDFPQNTKTQKHKNTKTQKHKNPP